MATDRKSSWLWYAGNESLSVFRIDPHRNSEAAQALLGKQLDGLLVTDAYAAYNAVRFCQSLAALLTEACSVVVPKSREARKNLADHFRQNLSSICCKPLNHEKAETLRKRIIPTSREYPQLFAFIKNDGPPTNNHAERSLRPLVIFRKICMGTRSTSGSDNIAIFGSLTQSATLQGAKLIDMFRALFGPSPNQAHDLIFSNPPKVNLSG